MHLTIFNGSHPNCSSFFCLFFQLMGFLIVSLRRNSSANNFPLTICVTTLLATIQLPVAYACIATPSAVTPVTTMRPSTPMSTTARPTMATSTSTSTSTPFPLFCCKPLLASPTNNTTVSNGIMTFMYNSNTCRALAIATCSQPTLIPPLQLMAAITVNQVHFMQIQPTTVSIPLICNRARQWETGEPPLIVSSIQCVLSSR